MRVLRLTALLCLRGGWRQRTVLVLTVAGVLGATALDLLALSVSPALGARGDRAAWRTPTPAAGPATAVQQRRDDVVRGDTIDVVVLAPTGAGTVPTPPGLDRAPGPGEVAVSPALAALLRTLPDDVLGDRYPDTVVGTIGPAGLAHADDLVAVVGAADGVLTIDPMATSPDGAPLPDAATAVDGFTRSGSDPDLAYY